MKSIFVYCLFLFTFSSSAQAGIDQLIYLTSSYLAFAESEFDLFLNSPNFEKNRIQFPQNAEIHHANIESLRSEYRHYITIQDKNFSQSELIAIYSKLLERKLYERLEHLEKQYKLGSVFYEKVKNMNDGEGPIQTQYVSTLPSDMSTYEPGDPQFVAAHSSLNRYHYRAFIIKHLLELIPRDAISDEIELLLRVSVSLHPFLKGETEDPEYPELAIYQISDSNNASLGEDLLFFRDPVNADAEIPVQDKSLGAKGKINTFNLPLFEALKMGFLNMNYKGFRSLPSIQWLFIKKAQEKPLAEKDLVSAKDSFFVDPIDYQRHLKTRNRILNSQKQNAKRKTKNRQLRSPLEKQQDPVEATKQTELELLQDESEGEPRAEELLPSQDQIASQEVGHSETEVVQNDQTSKELTSTVEHFSARGNRLFHHQQSKDQRDHSLHSSLLDRLTPAQINWLHDLFHHQLKTVRYRDFKQVWLKLNGPKSIVTSGGSSHQILLNEKGQKVSGIFAHSDAQEYSKAYHSYLRDAFFHCGITKRDL